MPETSGESNWRQNLNLPNHLISDDTKLLDKQWKTKISTTQNETSLFAKLSPQTSLKSFKSLSDLREYDNRKVSSLKLKRSKDSLYRNVLLSSQSVATLNHHEPEVMVTAPQSVCVCCGETVDVEDTNEDTAQHRDGELTSSALAWRQLYISRAKLQAASTASELLFGFAMIGLVELQINRPTNVPEGMFILFSINTSFLVVIHILALMISIFILPNIDTINSLHPTALIEESPHYKMRWFIDVAWAFATILGMFLFLFEVVLFAWFKFWDYSFSASLASTVFLVLCISIFIVFALYFYHTIHVYVYEYDEVVVKDIEFTNQRLNRNNK